MKMLGSNRQGSRGHAYRQAGFTLIELLVVIAIIGLLSAVVIASLNSARNKGADAAVKSNLANARAEAELFYDTGSTFDGVCAVTGTNIIGDSVRAAEAAYKSSLASTYGDSTASTFDTGQCHDDADEWVAWVPLKASVSGTIVAYCVDSTGSAGQETAVLAASAMKCP